MDLIATLVICVLLPFLFSLAVKKLKLSVVVGLIASGLLIGSSPFREIILGSNTDLILNIGDIGFLALMFLAGLEISWSMLYKERKDAIIIASFALAIPILLGFVVFRFLGFSFLTSITVGVCMGITAEATKVRVLLELKKLKTKLGSLMMGAGIIDDVLGILLFISISYWFTKSFAVKELLLLVFAISLFFIGILVHRIIKRISLGVQYFEKFLLIFIIPFFFISMGIHFSFQSLVLKPFLLLIIIITAMAGKIFGVLLTKPFTKLSLKQLYLVGWGMNSRGAVELAVAFIAFRIGLLSTEIYSSLVVMALTTTLIFPFFIIPMVKKEPHIMD